MEYIVKTIPHDQQNYETVGNWICGHNHLKHVLVSEMGNEDYAFLVGIHEQVEAWLCLKRGITQEAVDEFDLAFERDRDLGDEREPGHEPTAPYQREHREAEMVERLVAHFLGVDWDTYEQAILAL